MGVTLAGVAELKTVLKGDLGVPCCCPLFCSTPIVWVAVLTCICVNECSLTFSCVNMFMVVQLKVAQEKEVLCMLFNRALSTFTMTFIIKHIEYFNFRSKNHLNHSV